MAQIPSGIRFANPFAPGGALGGVGDFFDDITGNNLNFFHRRRAQDDQDEAARQAEIDDKLERQTGLITDTFEDIRFDYDSRIDQSRDIINQREEDFASRLAGIDDFFNTQIGEIIGSLNPTPFSDELSRTLKTEAGDNIAAQTDRALNRVSTGLANRGFQSGGSQGLNTATSLALGEIGTREGIFSDIDAEQVRQNTAASQFIGGLESQLRSAQASAQLEGALGANELAALEARIGDPTFIGNLMQDATSAIIGLEQSYDTQEFIRELMENSGTTTLEDILGFGGQIALANGNELVSSVLTGLPGIL